MIGFAGFADYPDLLRRLERAVGDDSYTAYIVGLDLGLPSAAARAFWLALGLGVARGGRACSGVVGTNATAFVAAIAASLALTPIVWLHYFALLLVVVALAQPRLGVPLVRAAGDGLTPGSGHPSPFETAWALATAAMTVGGRAAGRCASARGGIRSSS